MESVAQPHIKLIQISREKPRKYPAVLHSNYTLKLPGETGIILIPRSHPWLTKSGSLGLENRFPHSKWRPRDSDVQPWSRRNIQHLPQWNLFGSQRVLLKWFMSASSPISAWIVQQENVTKIMVSLCLEPYFWKKKMCSLRWLGTQKTEATLTFLCLCLFIGWPLSSPTLKHK